MPTKLTDGRTTTEMPLDLVACKSVCVAHAQ
jgi:hypothetical protein